MWLQNVLLILQVHDATPTEKQYLTVAVVFPETSTANYSNFRLFIHFRWNGYLNSELWRTDNRRMYRWTSLPITTTVWPPSSWGVSLWSPSKSNKSFQTLPSREFKYQVLNILCYLRALRSQTREVVTVNSHYQSGGRPDRPCIWLPGIWPSRLICCNQLQVGLPQLVLYC